MKKSFRILSGLLCLALLSGALAPSALAQGTVTKEESVYITLTPEGQIKTQTVSEWLHSDTGLRGVADRSTLTDITNLKGEETPRQENGCLYWDSDQNDVYYQGSTDATPPLTAAITYELDGQPMEAGELEGRSGHLRMTVALTNHTAQTVQLNGKTRTLCTPFVAVVGALLDGDHFTNIQAEQGTVQTDGSSQIAGFVCLPGVAKSLEGLLTGSLDVLADKFLDTVTLEADVTDFEMPSLMIAYASDPSLLDSGDLWQDADQAFSDLDELRSATDELLDGAKDLAGGAGELLDAVSGDLLTGAGDLADGAGKVKDGAAQLRDGARTLSDSVSGELAKGANSLDAGLGQLTAQNDALNQGAAAAADGVLALADSVLSAQLGQEVGLTWENYAQVLAAAAGVTDAQLAQARQKIGAQTGLEGARLNALIYLAAAELSTESPTADQLTQALTAAGQRMESAQQAAGPEGPIGQAQAALEGAGGDLLAVQPVIDTLWPWGVYTQAYQKALEAGLDEAAAAQAALQAVADTPYTGSEEDKAALASAYSTLADALGDASQEEKALVIVMACQGCAGDFSALESALSQAGAQAAEASAVQKTVEGFESGSLTESDPLILNFLTQAVVTSEEYAQAQGSLASLSQLLAGMQSLQSGISAYTQGVSQAKAGSEALAGSISGQLAQGARELAEGADTLAQGSSELADGAGTLYDSVGGKLLDGVRELKDGTDQLNDGVQEYDSEGIRKLTDSEDIANLKEVRAVAEELENRAESYTGYGGSPEGVASSTKFIMKVEAPEAPEETEAEAQPEAPKLTLWQRIKNLFGLG